MRAMFYPMRERRTLAWGLAAALAAIGCGGSNGSSYEIAAAPLSGKIGGQPWAVGTAETDAVLSDSSTFFSTFSGETVTGCSVSSGSSGSEVIMNIPTTPGDYDISLSLNVTLYDANTAKGRVATRGKLVVDAVSPSIVGGLHAIYGGDGNNEVNGRFDITVCGTAQ